MAYREMKIASVVVVGAMAAAAAIVAHRLPPGTQLPTHFNLGGEPDRFASAGEALFAPPIMAAALSLLMAALPWLEPLRDRLASSAPLYRIGWGGILALMASVEAMVIVTALGGHVPTAAPLALVGLLLIAIGNALPKSRPNFFIGLRTPWTISDPDTWIATHRLGAKTTAAAGLVFIAAALLPLSDAGRLAAIWAAVALGLVPLPYSFWYWRRHRPA